MNKLQSLKIKKVLKELDYVINMHDIMNETISEANSLFMTEVNRYAKNINLDNKLINKIENIENINENIINDIKSDTKKYSEKSEKLKRIFRVIVKKTHPDIITNDLLNDFYKKAVSYYENNDIIRLYNICNNLNIAHNIEEEDIKFISKEIKTLRKRTSFLQNTLSWKWYNSDTKDLKEKIITKYINNL